MMYTELLSALKESASYLTWAVFSFVACLSMYKVKGEREKNKVKTNGWVVVFSWVYFLFFLGFGLFNIWCIACEFTNQPTGAVVAVVAVVIAIACIVAIMVIINAAVVVFGGLEKNAEKSEGKMLAANILNESVVRILDTDKYPVTWLVQMDKDSVVFSRVISGDVDESYAPVNYDKANVYAASILNGLQPPKYLCQSDKQTD